MSNLKNFKDFDIEPVLDNFSGDRLLIDQLLNLPITIIDFIIEDSTKKPGTKRLKLQLEKNGIKHIHFSGSVILLQQIKKVSKEDFPFVTTIIREGLYLRFQ